MKKDWIEQAEEMLELAGCKEITTYDLMLQLDEEFMNGYS